ncbi:hypothetical protein IJM86_01090 [bacterium]|nr:hypothetical protein [bacterium]
MEGNVGTYYDLKIAWEDNVALKSMMLEHEGEIINSKETKKKKDEMILQNIFFDELGVATYQASAKDHFDNENIITINIEIKSPDITVVNIEETEE